MLHKTIFNDDFLSNIVAETKTCNMLKSLHGVDFQIDNKGFHPSPLPGGDSHIKVTGVFVLPFRVKICGSVSLRVLKSTTTTDRIMAVPFRVLSRKIRQKVIVSQVSVSVLS